MASAAHFDCASRPIQVIFSPARAYRRPGGKRAAGPLSPGEPQVPVEWIERLEWIALPALMAKPSAKLT